MRRPMARRSGDGRSLKARPDILMIPTGHRFMVRWDGSGVLCSATGTGQTGVQQIDSSWRGS